MMNIRVWTCLCDMERQIQNIYYKTERSDGRQSNGTKEKKEEEEAKK